MFGKLSVIVIAFTAFATFASDNAGPCKNHCSGTTLYTNGYKVCYAGEPCVCEYTEVANSPECPPPAPPERPKKVENN